MKVHKIFLASAVLAFSLPALASVDCSNANGTLVYNGYVYEGGVAPMPGMLYASQTWNYKGQVLARAEQYVTGEGNVHADTRLPLVEKITPGSSRDIATAGINQTDRTWVEQKTLTREDGGAVLPDSEAKSVTDWFLCHEVIRLLP